MKVQRVKVKVGGNFSIKIVQGPLEGKLLGPLLSQLQVSSVGPNTGDGLAIGDYPS